MNLGRIAASAGQNRNRGGIGLARQGLEEDDELLLFLRRQTERPHELRPARPIDAALVVVLDHGLERRDRSVMRVGTALSDLAQTRSLECMLHLFDRWQELAAADVGVGKTDVVEAEVGEIPS